ncbi:MAG TPA: DNA-formamidopyrimidine glycosylase family protein [Acidimicrobiales bacterium]|nr:DNA-formamidopyrimidine glycosylase family protein [Acidimicrobiales bacterium]
MPELPEVEALAAFLGDQLTGRGVRRVDPVAFSALKTFEPPLDALVGRHVGGVGRHGKFLDIELEGLHLVVHLARAGWVVWREEAPAARARPGKGPLALRLVLSGRDRGPDAALDFTEAGTQKRLAAYVVADPDAVPGVARLGIDPLEPAFTKAALAGILDGRRSQIKGVLTDQALIAGVGNAYSDEALHRSGLSPFRSAAGLSTDEVDRLHASLVELLTEAVERARGLPASGLKDDKRAGMRVHGRAGLPCPVCGDTVRSVSFADRSLQYCPTCQTGGKPLADRRLSRLIK